MNTLEAKSKEVPFKEGKITYRLRVVMDYIRRQLESDYFKEILLEQGVDNIATSGNRDFHLNKQANPGPGTPKPQTVAAEA